MNGRSRIGQLPEGAVSENSTSRRTFLKGVAVAGAAGLAAPLLTNTSARAATVPVILGANAPGPWLPQAKQPENKKPWLSAVPGAPGCRSYRDEVYSTKGQINDLISHGGFPGEPGSKPLTSMRFDPEALLSGDLDSAIKELIIDGAWKAVNGYFAAPPQLTVWHEAGHLYTQSSPFGKYKLYPHDEDGTPTNGDAAATVRQMHVKMKNLCDQVKKNNSSLPHVDYGCIIYGDIDKMANDNDLRGPTNWVPEASSTYPPLDWYGIDVYRTGGGTGSDCTHDDLTSLAKVAQYMDQFRAMVKNRSPNVTLPHINVCECNAHADADRSQFFWDLATWLHNNDGRRMLTFWKAGRALHGGPWSSAGTNTITTLNEIVSSYS